VKATVVVAVSLALFGLLDAMFAGFRASCGRTGLVDHGPEDMVALRRGLSLGLPLIAPIALAVVADSVENNRTRTYVRAGRAMLEIYVPYGLVVLLALAAYGTLHWRRSFIASAILLGPLTLVRPLVAIGGAVAAVLATRDVRVAVIAFAAVAVVLAVEPLAGRRWYSKSDLMVKHL
jgi:hypothetical protein